MGEGDYLLENKLIDSIDEHKSKAFELNQYLFKNPEVSGREYKSSLKIVELLKEYGIDAETNFFGMETAFFGRVIERPNSDTNIAIIVEYDALPELGHACGHSASAGISILSTLVLKANEDLINANVDIIGTPDEEDAGMKIPMAEGGVFDKYDMAIMVHLDTRNVPNWRLMAVQSYEIEFTGKPSHAAASPWDGRSALDGLMLSVHAFDMMRKSAKPYTVIEGFISDGGAATNIIPAFASGKYGFRSDSVEYLKNTLEPWMRDAVRGSAIATQTEAVVKEFGLTYSDMKYLDSGVEIIKDVMSDYGMKYEVMNGPEASSDIGNVSYRCPTFQPSVAITNEYLALHTKEFADAVGSEKSETCIENGAKVILGFISRLLEGPEKLKEIRREFESK